MDFANNYYRYIINKHIMSYQSKIFFIFFLAILVFSVSYTFYDTLVLRRFDIFVSEDEIPTYNSILDQIKNLTRQYVQ